MTAEVSSKHRNLNHIVSFNLRVFSTLVAKILDKKKILKDLMRLKF
jgi:hypothetical protein